MNYPIIETWNNFYRASEYRISARMLLRDVCPVAAPFYWERRIDRNWNPHVSISRGSLQAPSLRINERAKPRVIISTCPGVIKRPLTVPPSLPPSFFSNLDNFRSLNLAKSHAAWKAFSAYETRPAVLQFLPSPYFEKRIFPTFLSSFLVNSALCNISFRFDSK